MNANIIRIINDKKTFTNKKFMNYKLKMVFKKLRFYIILFMVAIVFTVGMRVFIFTSIIKIPSDSMSPAVLAGDFIIASKMIPGPRVFRNLQQIRVDGKVQTKRFKGIREVCRNDILVFNFPYTNGWDKLDMDLNVYYLKRCVAIPGDTFSIENGIYKVNNYPDSLGCFFRQEELAQMSRDDFSSIIWNSFPFDTVSYQWNIKDFGPLYVPTVGAVIAIDTLNITLYKSLIEYETDKRLFVRDGLVYLDNKIIKEYTFRLNYYFMAGDNLFDSKDSRYWGLLPEDCIIGKAIIITKSKDPLTDKFRWKRFFKLIK